MLYSLGVLLLCVVSLPLQIALYILIAVTCGFPVIFMQQRIGLHGRPFVLYKFRTMKRGAENEQTALLVRNEAKGPAFKIRDDPRYTKLGKFLGHTGLDELPQLYNILRGDMALFGPRPLPVGEAKKLTRWQTKRHTVKPGILSPWVLDGYHTQSFDAWMKSDITYATTKSFSVDFVLFVRAIRFMTRLFFRELTA